MAMKGSMKAVAALGAGYLLGRYPKLGRAAARTAATTVGVRSPVVRKGAKLLAGSKMAEKVPKVGALLRRIG
jgi:hypothetical protein